MVSMETRDIMRLNVDGGGGYCLLLDMGFPSGSAVKNPPVM